MTAVLAVKGTRGNIFNATCKCDKKWEKTNKQKKHNPALDKTAVFLTLLLLPKWKNEKHKMDITWANWITKAQACSETIVLYLALVQKCFQNDGKKNQKKPSTNDK